MKEPEAKGKFLASYYHRGAWWATTIYAVDWDDAETICKKLNMRLDGELKMTLPAIGGSFLPNVICWVRNAFAGKFAIWRAR